MINPLRHGDVSATATASGQAVDEVRRFPRREWVDRVRADQSHRWRLGIGVPAEEYFSHLPELRADGEEALVVINGEIILREELGQEPALEDYQQRFPDFSDRIALQFEVNRFLGTTTGDELTETDDSAPIELPGYKFLEKLGAGSAGVVYRARQESLARDVAVKLVRTVGADAKQVARQRQEAELLARLSHPNIVHIYEVLQLPGYICLVMEFVPGTTLAGRAGGRPMRPADAARLLHVLADAMEAVHSAGVLHRDLKPSNVLSTEAGLLKISDFGLAKLESRNDSLTSDSIVGTPSYMAPEQAGGDPQLISAAADVYSLGAILYELLSGRPPFLGATVLDTLSLIRLEEPVPLRRLQPQLPRDLETICLKCLAKTPDKRYPTAAALGDDLERFLSGAPIAARRPGPIERLARAAKRRPAVATAVVCLLVLAGVIGIASRMNAIQQRRMATAALVQSIATADGQALPQLLERLPEHGPEALGLVRLALADLRPPDPKWVNLSIAAVAGDPQADGDELLSYLPVSRTNEIKPIAVTLMRRAGDVSDNAWSMLLDQATSDGGRLRAACLAALIAPHDPRWGAAAPVVARALVGQHPLEVGTFSDILQPAAKSLTPGFISVYQDGSLEPVAREMAAGILARFADDQPTAIAELIVEADVTEFRLLLSALAKNPAVAAERLMRIAEETIDIEALAHNQAWETRHAVEAAFDNAQRRRALALIAMWRLGECQPALAALSRKSEPALRAWLIEQLAIFGLNTDDLWTQTKDVADPGVREALILAMGQLPLQSLSIERRKALTTALLELYGRHEDAGVHSACRWLLVSRLGAGAQLFGLDEALRGGVAGARNWYVGANKHTYSVLRGPLEFTMGSPASELSREEDEATHRVRLQYSLAVATHEVTVAQFLKAKDRYFNNRYSATDDCPANNITWFDAAAYCRWLSEQEGLPEEQMCYPPMPEIGPGMELPANWRERTGYRLPTEAEWEYACRGGVQTSRYCGEGKQLLRQYAWFVENSDDHAWPVGQLKPNSFGLFDMLGNVTERCLNPLYRFTSDAKTAADKSILQADLLVSPNSSRAFRGANFGDAEHNVRAARRNANSVSDEWALVGFRPVRRLPESP